MTFHPFGSGRRQDDDEADKPEPEGEEIAADQPAASIGRRPVPARRGMSPDAVPPWAR